MLQFLIEIYLFVIESNLVIQFINLFRFIVQELTKHDLLNTFRPERIVSRLVIGNLVVPIFVAAGDLDWKIATAFELFQVAVVFGLVLLKHFIELLGHGLQYFIIFFVSYLLGQLQSLQDTLGWVSQVMHDHV